MGGGRVSQISIHRILKKRKRNGQMEYYLEKIPLGKTIYIDDIVIGGDFQITIDKKIVYSTMMEEKGFVVKENL